jgi:hypothetical protein
MAIGIAETNEEHRVDTEGAFAFGRNNLVQNESSSNSAYSGAIGRESHAHMMGSLAHSSFPVSTGVKGDCQYVRVLTKSHEIDQDKYILKTGGDNILTFPFANNGSAIVTSSIVGNVDASAKIVFRVSWNGVTYDFTGLTILQDIGFDDASTDITVSATNAGFYVQLIPTNGQSFCGTFKITMQGS